MAGPATLRIDILANARDAQRGVRQTESGLSRLGRTARGAGMAVGAGLAVAGTALVGLGVAAVRSASDQQQAFGAVESVFGRYAGTVTRSARAAADAVGLSATEYANMAAIVGSQLRNMGRSQAEAAKQSDSLIRMGSDLAATFGGSVSDAVEAVSSLLRGERDPIERYGVSIKQADIDAQLAAQGLDKLKGAAKRQAEATATLTLLTQQTGAAHGAFGRESNTLAGQQERLRARLDNTKATIGRALLPALTALFGWLNARVMPAVGRVASRLSTELGPALTRAGAWIQTRLVPAAQQLWRWFNANLRPAFEQIARGAIRNVTTGFQAIAGAIERNRPQLQTLLAALGRLAGFLARTMAPVLSRLAGSQFRLVGEAIGGVITVVSRLVDMVETAVGAFNRLKDAASAVPNAVGGIVGKINPFSGPVTPMTSPLLAARARTGQLATAAAGSYELGAVYGRAAAGGGLVVDQRSFPTTVRVDGALDPVAVGRQLERILADHAVRLGRTTAYAAGRG